jgi:hypothetical protein
LRRRYDNMAKKKEEAVKLRDPMTICVDFDGTCVTHEYPNIGLYTMRDEKFLAEAVKCCRDHGVTLMDANRNRLVNWSRSPKVYADLYIDDCALGIPLIGRMGMPAYVDWQEVTRMLVRDRIIPYKRRCRICGCADDDCHECQERTGAPCEWTRYGKSLCSACVGRTLP